MPPMRRKGKTSTASVMMPNPPSQVSSHRHSRMPIGAVSSPVMTVEPVAVRPDIVSKTAFAYDKRKLEKTNGRAENATTATHVTGAASISSRTPIA